MDGMYILTRKKNLNIDPQQAEANRLYLHFAATGDKPKLIESLESGVHINAIDSRKRTALMLAIEGKHFEVAKYLIEKKIILNAQDDMGYTTLMYAAYKQPNIKIVRLLLPHINTHGINLTDNHNRTVLILMTRMKRSTSITKLLLTRIDIDLDVIDKDGKTALMYSALTDDLYVLNLLILAGATIQLANKQGETALLLASKFKKERTLFRLLNTFPLQRLKYLFDAGLLGNLIDFSREKVINDMMIYHHSVQTGLVILTERLVINPRDVIHIKTPQQRQNEKAIANDTEAYIKQIISIRNEIESVFWLGRGFPNLAAFAGPIVTIFNMLIPDWAKQEVPLLMRNFNALMTVRERFSREKNEPLLLEYHPHLPTEQNIHSVLTATPTLGFSFNAPQSMKQIPRQACLSIKYYPDMPTDVPDNVDKNKANTKKARVG